MSPLGLVFLVALMSPAQNAPQDAPKPDRESLQRQVLQDLVGHPDRIAQLQSPSPNAPTCFTMRTYYFKRHDGAAPTLAGTSTCTPANAFRSEKARRMNPPQLVPLKLQ